MIYVRSCRLDGIGNIGISSKLCRDCGKVARFID